MLDVLLVVLGCVLGRGGGAGAVAPYWRCNRTPYSVGTLDCRLNRIVGSSERAIREYSPLPLSAAATLGLLCCVDPLLKTFFFPFWNTTPGGGLIRVIITALMTMMCEARGG